jgi:hypothetical protein
MTTSEICAERLSLLKAMGEATNRAYALMKHLDQARRAKADINTIDELRTALQAARDTELRAQRAYTDHVVMHGCFSQRNISLSAVPVELR